MLAVLHTLLLVVVVSVPVGEVHPAEDCRFLDILDAETDSRSSSLQAEIMRQRERHGCEQEAVHGRLLDSDEEEEECETERESLFSARDPIDIGWTSIWIFVIVVVTVFLDTFVEWLECHWLNNIEAKILKSIVTELFILGFIAFIATIAKNLIAVVRNKGEWVAFEFAHVVISNSIPLIP